MKILTLNECGLVAGGLRPSSSKGRANPDVEKPPGRYGSDSQGGYGYGFFAGYGGGWYGSAGYSASNQLLGSTEVQNLAAETSLLPLINENGISVVKGANTQNGGPPNNSSTSYDTEFIYVPSSDQNAALDEIEQIAHETGHVLNPQASPSAYSVESTYVNAMCQNEGLAQQFAINEAEELQQMGYSNAYAPANTVAQSEQMQQIYNSDVQEGASTTKIAQDLAPLMCKQVLGNGQTEQQYYESQWVRAHQ